MAIVIRIVSADGKKIVMKSLPGLPARLKVPAGAKVEVTEDERTVSLAQYVNEHANRKDPDHILDTEKVVIETAESWEAAESWMDSLAAPDRSAPNDWFSTAKDERGAHVVGLDLDALLIGGAVVAGVGFGAYELTRDKKAKDTVAPTAPGGFDLSAEDDNGLSTTDNITTKSTGLTFLGAAEAGSTVELFDGTTKVGTTTANTLGIFTLDIDLAEGEHTVTAKAKDTAGNVSSASSAIKVVVDTTAPAAAGALDLDAADDTGASNTDNVTSKTTGLTITGTAEAGSRVELFDGATSLGTATAGTAGTFTKDVDLPLGTHTITAKITDAAGNAGPVSQELVVRVDASATFNLDLAAADDTGTIANDNITNKTSGLTIVGAITPNATVELFDGTTSLGTVVADASGAFTKDISLAAGAHAVTARVTGGGGVSEVLNITVDTTAPLTPTNIDLLAADDRGLSDSDNITGKLLNFTITGNGEPGSTIELFYGNLSLGFATVNGSGVFTRTVGQIPAGTHNISARASDLAGNVSAVSNALIVTFDPDAPAAPGSLDLAAEDDNGSSSTDNITSKTSDLTISGTAEAGSTVELFDGNVSLGTITAAGNGTFVADVSLGVGSHAITARATDVAGNLGSPSTALQITVVAAAQSAGIAIDDSQGFSDTSLPLGDFDPLSLGYSSGSIA